MPNASVAQGTETPRALQFVEFVLDDGDNNGNDDKDSLVRSRAAFFYFPTPVYSPTDSEPIPPTHQLYRASPWPGVMIQSAWPYDTFLARFGAKMNPKTFKTRFCCVSC